MEDLKKKNIVYCYIQYNKDIIFLNNIVFTNYFFLIDQPKSFFSCFSTFHYDLKFLDLLC